jgi:twinkle protein
VTAPESNAGITYLELGIRIPPGKTSGDVKVHCPKCHDTRHNRMDKSLSVDLDNGQWLCHYPKCDWRSGLVLEARSRDSRGSAQTPRTPSPDTPAPSVQSVAPPSTILHDWAIQWLDDRAIPESFAREFGLTSSEVGNERQIHFPYRVDGELVNVKTRILPKGFKQTSGAQKSLFNIDSCQGVDTVVICEGELDCLACAVAGWHTAVSAPDGAAASPTDRKMGAFDTDASVAAIKGSRRVVLAVDGDSTGFRYADALQAKFGPLKIWRVEWPENCKDANDVLMQFGAETLSDVLQAARPVDLPGIANLEDHIDELLEIYDTGYQRGASTGWPGFDDFYQIYPGTVTLITGIPSHGKSSWLNHLLVNVSANNDWRVGMFSPEQGSNATLLMKLVQIAQDGAILPGAQERQKREAVRWGGRWVADRFKRIDAAITSEDGAMAVGLHDILGRASDLVVRHDIKLLVMDPWGRIESMRPKGLTETEWIGQAINMISRWSQRNDVATFVVAHPRKQETGKSGEDEGWVSPYEIQGSSYWFAFADFILAIKRNKYEDPKDHAFVRTWKVREEGLQGNLGIVEFTYDARSRRFYDISTEIPFQSGLNPLTGLPVELRQGEAPVMATGYLWDDAAI